MPIPAPSPRLGRLLLPMLALALALACGSGGNGGGGHQDPLPPPNPKVAWSGAQILETNLLCDSRYPSVAVNASGDALVAWERNLGGVRDLWAKPFSSTSGWQPEGTIESADGNAWDAKVAVSANGSFLVTWDQETPGGSESGIYARKWVPGTNMTAVQRINDSAAYGFSPTVAMDQSGNACIAWMEPGNFFLEIKVSRYSSSTGTWTAPLTISNASATSTDALWPTIQMDPAGNTAVVWFQATDSRNGPFSLNGAFFKAGAGWTLPANLQVGTGTVDPGCALAMGAGGGLLAWCETLDGGTSYQVFTRSWASGSNTVGAPVRVSAPTANTTGPSLGVDAQGNAWLAWTQVNGSTGTLALSRYTPSAGWSATPQTFPTGSGSIGMAKVSMNANGDTAMVWQQMNDGSHWSINGALCAAGGSWSAPSLLETDDAGHAYAPEVSMGKNGQAVAAWYQLDAGGIRHIFANRAK